MASIEVVSKSGCCVLTVKTTMHCLYSLRLLVAFEGVDESDWSSRVTAEISKRMSNGTKPIWVCKGCSKCSCQQRVGNDDTKIQLEDASEDTQSHSPTPAVSVPSSSSSLSPSRLLRSMQSQSQFSQDDISIPGESQGLEVDAASSVESRDHDFEMTLANPDCEFRQVSSRISWSHCKRNLDSIHRSYLLGRIEFLENKLSESNNALKRARRQNTQLTAKLDTTKSNLQLSKVQQTNSDLSVLEVSKHKVRLTRKGLIALGIRMGLAVTSAVSFPLTALVDTSRWTVTRCETIVWSVLRARTRCFHTLILKTLSTIAAQMANCDEPSGGAQPSTTELVPTAIRSQSEDQLVAYDLGLGCATFHNSDSLFLLGGTGFATDATNSNIWRRNKLQAVMIESAIMNNAAALGTQRYIDAFAMHRSLFLVPNKVWTASPNQCRSVCIYGTHFLLYCDCDACDCDFGNIYINYITY